MRLIPSAGWLHLKRGGDGLLRSWDSTVGVS